MSSKPIFHLSTFIKILKCILLLNIVIFDLKKPRYLNVDFDVLSSIFISQGVPYQLIQEK